MYTYVSMCVSMCVFCISVYCSLPVHVCVYTYTCVFVCVHMCFMCACESKNMCTCICVFIHKFPHVCVHGHMSMCLCIACVCVRVCESMPMYVRFTFLCARMCVCMWVNVHAPKCV